MAERKTFLLRVDPVLWAELESWAQDELRSVNGQVEFLLKQAVAKRRGKGEVISPPVKPTPPPKPEPSSDNITSGGYDLLD